MLNEQKLNVSENGVTLHLVRGSTKRSGLVRHQA